MTATFPAHLFVIRGKRRVFKISLGARLMQSWKQCALLATTMAIWQIMASAHDFLLLHCSSYAQVQELQRSHWCDKREDTLFSWLHIYYACLAPVRFEQYVSWITYDHLCNIYIHRQVCEQITWYRCETLHVIFPCLALGAWLIPQSIELRRTFECGPY